MKRIFAFGLVTPGSFALLVLSSVLTGAGTMLLLHLVSQEILGKGVPHAPVVFLAVMGGTFAIQEAGARYAIRRTQIRLHSLRENLLTRTLDADYAHAEQFDRARFMSALSQDSNLIGALLPSLVTSSAALTTIILILAYIGTVSWLSLVVCMGVMALGLLNFRLVSRSANNRIRAAYRAQDQLMDIFGAALNMLAYFKQSSTRRQLVLEPVFNEANQECVENAILGQNRLTTASNSTYMMLFVVLGIVVFVLPGFGLTAQEETVAITSGLLFLAMPFARLVSSAAVLPISVLAIERITALDQEITAGSSESRSVSPLRTVSAWSQISLRGIEFEYEVNGKPGFHLGPVSLDLNRGEVLFITGFNGAGKTTLGKVLTGLYKPCGGEILLDGHSVNEADAESYRKLFSIIHRDQEIDNRLFRADRPAFAALANSASALGYGPADLPQLDEHRDLARLSTGQQRRLLLFFAYHARRPILFLDEWAADQDPKARKFFYETVLSRLRSEGFTVVAISHDDAYFHHADRVIEIAPVLPLDAAKAPGASKPLALTQ